MQAKQDVTPLNWMFRSVVFMIATTVSVIMYLAFSDPFNITCEKPMTPESEKERIIESFDVYGITGETSSIITDALESPDWDWYTDCDGCTAVPDLWPTKYSPPCLVHDWLWMTGRGGAEADKIFLKLMLAYKVPSSVAYVRYGAVRVAWWTYYKWKHMFKGEVKVLESKYKLLI